MELITVDHVLLRPRGVQEPGRHRAVDRPAVPDHGHQRHNSRSPADEEEWPAHGRLPDEVPADGTPQLQVVTNLDLVNQIWRYLPVVQPLDGERYPLLFLGR